MGNCDEYPRILKGWLSKADVEHLKEIYKTSVEEAFAARKERNRPIQYYDLLRYLHTSHPRDVHLQEIIEKIHQQVEKQFGPGYLIVHDFWSYRAPGSFPAPIMHTDPAFWMTGRLDGFNLWFLLDHSDMGYGIDVLTKEDNQEFYSCSALGLPHGPPFLFAGKSSTCPAFIHRVPLRKWPVLFEWQNDLANALGTVFCAASTWWLQAAVNLGKTMQEALPASAFRGLLHVFGWLGSIYPLPPMTLKPRRFELEIGDAAVIRQDELHGTDKEPLKEGQFRLAIGFKFMRQAPVRQYLVNGPSATLRRQCRGLKLPLGTLLNDPYRQSTLDLSEDTGALSGTVSKALNGSATRFIAPDRR
eukprot:s1437_g18.t2